MSLRNDPYIHRRTSLEILGGGGGSDMNLPDLCRRHEYL